jgi:hypothetical protein
MTKLLEALENAKQNFKNLEKSGKNNFFKTQNGVHTYSTLEDIFKSCKDALYENKLSLHYTLSFEDNIQYLITTLTHIDTNESIHSKSAIGTVQSTPQQIGSGITYFRRYHIQAMLNLEADFDDDGNIASNVKQPTQQTTKPKGL